MEYSIRYLVICGLLQIICTISVNGQPKLNFTNKGQIEWLNTGNCIFIGQNAGENTGAFDLKNVFIGNQCGLTNVTGSNLTAVGYGSLEQNTDGANNVAIGYIALQSNTTGTWNTAVGSFSMEDNISGGSNTAVGFGAMRHNLTGEYNSAFGAGALQNMTDGDYNTAVGLSALVNNLGSRNSAFGYLSLSSNISGTDNIALGYRVQINNTQGSRNCSMGSSALISNTVGDDNTGLGHRSGFGDHGESNANVYIGSHAGSKLTANSTIKSNNVMIGFEAGYDATGSNNVFIGYQAGKAQTGSNKLYIENSDSPTPLIYGDFNLDRVGIGVTALTHKLEVAGAINASSGLIGSHTALRAQGAEAVWFDGTQFSWGFGGSWNRFADSVRIGGNVSPTHMLQVDGIARSTQSTWATTSDVRVKENITTLQNAMSMLLQFRPVTFNWSEAYRTQHPELKIDNYGFISQEVERIIPSMVTVVKEKIGGATIEDFRVLNTDALVPLLVRAIQEQQEMIEKMRREQVTFSEEKSEILQRLAAVELLLNKEKSGHNEMILPAQAKAQ